MEIKFLEADHGDCIIIKVFDKENPKNILIDGGPGKTYMERDQRSGRWVDKPLKKELDKIFSEGQIVDLLILTHVDDDHIGGLLKWIGSGSFRKEQIGEVWFNSGRNIFEHFNLEEIPENLIDFDIEDEDKNTGIKQGEKFEDYLQSLDLWDKKVIKGGGELNRFNLRFDIISPGDEQLKELLHKWDKETDSLFTAKGQNDYSSTIDELLEDDTFEEDKSVHNGSSIAFILSREGKNFLFLGDAHPSVVVKHLKALKYTYDDPLECEVVKVSHHGSKANTNSDLLRLIKSNHFVISANGKHHHLPNKRCVARILNHHPKAKISFNYSDLVNEIFEKEEREKFDFEPNLTINI